MGMRAERTHNQFIGAQHGTPRRALRAASGSSTAVCARECLRPREGQTE
jgi:hypothetical protein